MDRSVVVALLAALAFPLGGALRMQEDGTVQAYWQIFGSGGPKFDDIAQGELGTCYFLAGIGAIAHRQPSIIDKMFVERQLWNAERPVYTTEWLLNGKPVRVAVDGQLPIDPKNNKPFFVKTNNGQDAWPLVLEKSWAKVFGSFRAVSGGRGEDVFKSITQAPVELRKVKKNNDLWAQLMRAKQSNFPMTAAVSHANNHNLPSGHEYVVLDVSESQRGTDGKSFKAVRIYNPWGTQNKYCGIMPNPNRRSGAYWMALHEFEHAFEEITWAEVKPDAHLSWQAISLVGNPTTVTSQFTMKKSNPFAVQLEWPNRRFTAECERLQPAFQLIVAKNDDLTNFKGSTQTAGTSSNARVDMPGGAGQYSVIVHARFPEDVAWLKEVVVNVYGMEQTTWRESTVNSADLFIQMNPKLCNWFGVKNLGKYVGTPGFFKKSSQTMNGVTMFQNEDSATQYQIMYYGGGTWRVTDTIESAQSGRYFTIDSLDLDNDVFGCGGDPYDAWIKMGGLCDRFQVKGVSGIKAPGIFVKSKTLKVAGVPVFEAENRNRQINMIFSWAGKFKTIDTIDNAQKGLAYDTLDVATQVYGCAPGESLLQLDAEAVTSDAEDVDSSLQQAEAFGLKPLQVKELSVLEISRRSQVSLEADLAACDDVLKRMKDLNKATEIARKGDTVFPPEVKSIGPGTCGDSATGKAPKQCSDYDHWQPMESVLDKIHEEELQRETMDNDARRCLKGVAKGNQCTITNNCEARKVVTLKGYAASINTNLQWPMYGGGYTETEILGYCEVLHNLNPQAVTGYTPHDPCAGFGGGDTGGDDLGGGEIDEDDSGECLAAGLDNGACKLINTCTQAYTLETKAYNPINIPAGSTKRINAEVCQYVPAESKRKFNNMERARKHTWKKCLTGGIVLGNCVLANTCTKSSEKVVFENYNPPIVVAPGAVRTEGSNICGEVSQEGLDRFDSVCIDYLDQCPGWASSCGNKYSTVNGVPKEQVCKKTCNLC